MVEPGCKIRLVWLPVSTNVTWMYDHFNVVGGLSWRGRGKPDQILAREYGVTTFMSFDLEIALVATNPNN